MPKQASFLQTISKPSSVVTAIPSGLWFPESLEVAKEKYGDDIAAFVELVKRAKSSAELLELIRVPRHAAKRRMSLLKLYRRCVALILDTEMTKKSRIRTRDLIEAYGETFFKPILKLDGQLFEPAFDPSRPVTVEAGTLRRFYCRA